uniref:threonylcarbamoyl-AMP synthase isoform X2 n=1 Tax=Myxine glutinosa TaxID=7769 RepID=UPI00358FC6FC
MSGWFQCRVPSSARPARPGNMEPGRGMEERRIRVLTIDTNGPGMLDGSSNAQVTKVLGEAERVLGEGGVVALPTDTVYGLACLAQRTSALKTLYTIKSRVEAKPLAICLAEPSQVYRFCNVTISTALLNQLLPGPVTLVFERSSLLNPELNPYTQLVGVRVPRHLLVQELVRRCGGPLALTSANLSGKPSCLCVEEFRPLWPSLSLVIDGGPSSSNHLGSTVIDLSSPGCFNVLRHGCAYEETMVLLEHEHGLIEKH